jgi:hypothetical protein
VPTEVFRRRVSKRAYIMDYFYMDVNSYKSPQLTGLFVISNNKKGPARPEGCAGTFAIFLPKQSGPAIYGKPEQFYLVGLLDRKVQNPP